MIEDMIYTEAVQSHETIVLDKWYFQKLLQTVKALYPGDIRAGKQPTCAFVCLHFPRLMYNFI